MTGNDQQLDRRIATWMADVAARPSAEGAEDVALLATRAQSPLPGWRARWGSAWTDGPAGSSVPAMVRRPGALLLGVTAVLVAIAFIGVQGFSNSVVGPGRTPTAQPPTGQPGSAVPTVDPTVDPTGPRSPQDWTWPPTRFSNVPDVQAPIGELEAGVHDLLDFDRQGFNIQFNVPAGWVWTGRSLTKRGAGDSQTAEIYFFGGPLEVYADPCHWDAPRPAASPNPWPTPERTLDQFVFALAAQPSRQASVPSDLRRYAEMGHRAVAIVLTVPSVDFATCDGGAYRSWTSSQAVRSHQGAGQIDVVWAFDVYGAGTADVPPLPGGLVVDAAFFPGTSAQVVAEIEAILASLYISHWG